MCGIAGIVYLEDRRVERRDVERMGDKLAHRGPEGKGFYLVGPVGFVRRRLSIIDLEHGNQSMTDRSGMVVEDFLQGRRNAGYKIWNLLMLDGWLRANTKSLEADQDK